MSVYECQHCKDELTYTQYFRSPYCGQAACQRAKVQHYLAEQKKNLISKLITQCKDRVQHLAGRKRSKTVPAALKNLIKQSTPVIALLPVNKKPLTALPAERKNAFLQHLRSLFADVKNEQPTASPSYSSRLDEPLSADESDLLGKACATCKGSCCGLGKTHAFQDYPSLKYFLAAQTTDIQEEELIDLYSQYFPNISHRDACVFQGAQGCTLPSDLRSFTCRNYRCDGLRSYHHEILQSGNSFTFAAAVDDAEIINTSVYNDEYFLRLDEKKY